MMCVGECNVEENSPHKWLWLFWTVIWILVVAAVARSRCRYFHCSSVTFLSPSSVWTRSLSSVETSIVISPAAPTCHQSAVIETLIIPHKTMCGWKTERERQGPISISAAAWLPGVPGSPRDLIWRRLWELKSYLSRFTAEERSRRRILFMHWRPAPANHCGYYKSCAFPTCCQKNARMNYWFSLFLNYCMHFFSAFLLFLFV